MISINCTLESNGFPSNVNISGGSEDQSGINNRTIVLIQNGTVLPQNSMYHSNRWGETTYEINGLDNTKHYKIVLHFAEIYFGTDGSYSTNRFFDILINNVTVKKTLI